VPRGNTKAIVAVAALVVVLAGGGFWAYTARQQSGEKPNVGATVPAPQPQGTAAAAVVSSAEKSEPNPAEADKTAPSKKTKPSDEPVRTATEASRKAPAMAAPVASAGKSGGLDGIYSGQICFAESKKDAARCFHGEGTVAGSKLAGKWPMGKETGVVMNLTGHIAPSGEVEIEMHSKTADGTVLNNIFLTGTIQDGLMTAKGAFQMRRKVTLDWHKN